MVMKLASFYGCTAPMLLLVYDKIGKDNFIQAIAKLDNATDKDSLLDAKAEIASFIASVSKYPNRYSSALNKMSEEQIHKLGRMCKDSSEFQECRMFLMTKVVEKILALLDTNEINLQMLCADNNDSNSFSESNAVGNLRAALDTRIDKVMHSQSHEPNSEYLLSQEVLSMHNSVVRKFIKRANSPEVILDLDPDKIKNNLISKFKVSSVLETTITKGDKVIHVTDNCLKIIQYYKNREHDLQEIEKLFQSSVKQNTKLFDCNARVFFKKQPDFATRVIRAAFKSPSIISNRSRLLNEKARLLEEVKKTKEFMNAHVVSKTTKANLVGITNEQLLILESNSNPDSIVINALKNGNLTPENLTIDTVELLLQLEDASNISLEQLNEVYGTNYNYEELEQDVDLLKQLNIGGVNCFTHYLFSKSLSSLTLSLFDKVIISDEAIHQFKFYIEEVEILLNNMKGVV